MLTDILEVNQKTLAELYQFAIASSSNALVFGPAGVGKCVTGDTLIFTEEGLIPIKNLIPKQFHLKDKSSYGDLSIKILNNKGEESTSSRWYCDGEGETIEVTTKSGFVIKGTAKHQIIVATDQGPAFKRLDQITANDYVGIVRKGLPFGKTELPSDLSYLIGYFVGDGSFTRDSSGNVNGIRYSVGDQDLNEFLTKNGSNIDRYLNRHKVYKYPGKATDIQIYKSKNIEGGGFDPALFEKECGSGAANKRVPSFVLQGSKNVWKNFLSGLFDADGSISNNTIELTSKSHDLVKTIQIMLTAFGIIGRVKNKIANNFVFKRIIIQGDDARKFISDIGFRLERKQKSAEFPINVNSNIDLVPVSNELWGRLKAENIFTRKAHKLIYDYSAKGKMPGRSKVKEILSYVNTKSEAAEILTELSNNFYFWDRIDNLSKGKDIVFDLVIPDSHSFAGGGVMNHNTEMAMGICKGLGLNYRYLNLSVLEAPDLMGLPTTKEGKTVYAPPEFLPEFDPNEELLEPIVLIVDELDKAKDEVESPMLELFQFRSINGKQFNIQSVIATGNLPDEKAKSRLVSHALANRCLIYKVRCEFEPWRQWAVSANVNPLVVGFLDKHPEYLLLPNATKDPTAYCKPSPRAWSRAARELDFLQSNSDIYQDISFKDLRPGEDNISKFAQTIVAGRVGMAASVKFKVWVDHYRKYEPVVEALLYNGEFPDRNLTSEAMIIIAMSAMREFKNGLGNLDEKVLHQMSANVFGWLLEKHVAPDYALAAGRAVFSEQIFKKHNLKSYPNVKELYQNKVRVALDKI